MKQRFIVISHNKSWDMSWFNKTNEKRGIEWIELNSIELLSELVERSKEKPIAIFKHSTRCSTSSMVKSRLERGWDLGNSIEMYYLDLIRYRAISDQIAVQFGVQHESPQIILLKNGAVVYHDSHTMIEVEKLRL